MILNFILLYYFIFFFSLFSSPFLPSSFFITFIFHYFSRLCPISGSRLYLFICQSIYLSIYSREYIPTYIRTYIHVYAYFYFIYICIYISTGVGHTYTQRELSTYDYLFLMYGNHPFSSLNPSTL